MVVSLEAGGGRLVATSAGNSTAFVDAATGMPLGKPVSHASCNVVDALGRLRCVEPRRRDYMFLTVTIPDGAAVWDFANFGTLSGGLGRGARRLDGRGRRRGPLHARHQGPVVAAGEARRGPAIQAPPGARRRREPVPRPPGRLGSRDHRRALRRRRQDPDLDAARRQRRSLPQQPAGDRRRPRALLHHLPPPARAAAAASRPSRPEQRRHPGLSAHRATRQQQILRRRMGLY